MELIFKREYAFERNSKIFYTRTSILQQQCFLIYSKTISGLENNKSLLKVLSLYDSSNLQQCFDFKRF